MDEVAAGRDRLEKLGELAVLAEQPFTSGVPILGRFIAAFRAGWNNVSTRWYVRPMAHQQTLFNLSTVEELASLRAENEAFRAELARMQEWLIAQDHDQTDLRHDLGELTVVVVRHDRALGAYAERGQDGDAIPPNDPPA